MVDDDQEVKSFDSHFKACFKLESHLLEKRRTMADNDGIRNALITVSGVVTHQTLRIV